MALASADTLNLHGLNSVRFVPGRGIRVWGAGTLSSNGLWKYVSVRRLFIFLERSIYEGTQWVVFEPNDDRLSASVTDAIRLLLSTQWRNGALVGSTEQEAFCRRYQSCCCRDLNISRMTVYGALDGKGAPSDPI